MVHDRSLQLHDVQSEPGTQQRCDGTRVKVSLQAHQLHRFLALTAAVFSRFACVRLSGVLLLSVTLQEM